MPTYQFINKKTKKIVEHVMSIAAYDEFKAAHPELERYFGTAPGFSMNGRTVTSGGPDNTFKEVLSKIGEKYRGSPLDQTYNRKTVKRVKTEQAVKKNREKLAKRLQGK
jgi:hypothetical protein